MQLYLQHEDITFHSVFFLIAAVGPFIPDMVILFSALMHDSSDHDISTVRKWTEEIK